MTPLRPIIARARGQRHGPINRLISPDDLGDRLKPFIFLDFFDAEIERYRRARDWRHPFAWLKRRLAEVSARSM